jgi:hypothetical protein
MKTPSSAFRNRELQLVPQTRNATLRDLPSAVDPCGFGRIAVSRFAL